MLPVNCLYYGIGKYLQRELENLINISFLYSELIKTKLKVNFIPTLFFHSKPKQKRKWSMKRSEVCTKKQVFNLLRNIQEVKKLWRTLAKVLNCDLSEYFLVADFGCYRNINNFCEDYTYSLYEVLFALELPGH